MQGEGGGGEAAVGVGSGRQVRTGDVLRLCPALCAIHCLALPLVVGFAPWLGSAGAEAGLAVASLLISAALLAGDVRIHGHVWLAAPLVVCAALWAGSLTVAPEAVEPLLTVVGGLGSAATLFASARLRAAAAGSCACPGQGG